MVTTTNLLTAFMLGGWLAVAPAAYAATPNSILQKGNTYLGDARMAGIIPSVRGPQLQGRVMMPARVRREGTGVCQTRANNRCLTNAQARQKNLDPYGHLNQ